MWSGTGKRGGRFHRRDTPDGTVSHTIKRAHLHRVLHDQAVRRGVRVEFGKRVTGVEIASERALARFEDGSEAAGDVLIGCDGIRSIVRRTIDPKAPAPRYVGLLNFGGYTRSVAAAEPGSWHMIFGKRAFFGYATDPAGGTVWFANVPRTPATQAERASTTGEHWKRWLIDLFADDRGPATELIAAGALELAADNTHDLPFVPTWHNGPLIIIGDAAHAPSPSSGQGASIAIEDSVLLAKCLRDIRNRQGAFVAFERLRRQRVERIVAQGARSGSSKALGPMGRTLRDLMLPFVFKHVVTEKSLAWMYDHHIEWDSRLSTLDPLSISSTLNRRVGRRKDNNAIQMIVKASKESEAGAMPDEKILADMAKYNEELVQSRGDAGGSGLHPSSKGARVKYSVTTYRRGWALCGNQGADRRYWMIQVKSRDEALAWPSASLPDGEVEIRQLFELEDFAPSDAIEHHRKVERELAKQKS